MARIAENIDELIADARATIREGYWRAPLTAETIMKDAHSAAVKAKAAARAAEEQHSPLHPETRHAQDLAVVAAMNAYRSCAAKDEP